MGHRFHKLGEHLGLLARFGDNVLDLGHVLRDLLGHMWGILGRMWDILGHMWGILGLISAMFSATS